MSLMSLRSKLDLAAFIIIFFVAVMPFLIGILTWFLISPVAPIERIVTLIIAFVFALLYEVIITILLYLLD